MKYVGKLLICCFLLVFNYHSSSAAHFKLPGNAPRSDPCEKTTIHSVKMVNNTLYDLEYLIHWTCSYLNINDVTICIAYQTKKYKQDGFVIKEGDIYFIYLKKDTPDLKLILIHELIHVKQYESNDLILKNKFTVMFKGREINLKKMNYNIRPYEIEAHSNDGWILKEYNKQIKALRKITNE